MSSISLHSLLATIAQRLKHAGIDSQLCEQYSWWLLEALLHKSKITLLTQNELIMTPEKQAMLDTWLDQLVTDNMPIAYIIGMVPFCDVTIFVEPPILIPRPETEEWVHNLINQLQQLPNPNITILDIATGSGCIAIALAKALPQAMVYASDISSAAIALAQKNSAHNNISNIHFFTSDLFTQLPAGVQFDLIISNPPYIPAHLWDQLDPSVRNWEDKSALIAADNGMYIVKKIIDAAPFFLKNSSLFVQLYLPQLILEVDCTHTDAVKEYMQAQAFADVVVSKDYVGNDRVVNGKMRRGVAPLF